MDKQSLLQDNDAVEGFQTCYKKCRVATEVYRRTIIILSLLLIFSVGTNVYQFGNSNWNAVGNDVKDFYVNIMPEDMREVLREETIEYGPASWKGMQYSGRPSHEKDVAWGRLQNYRSAHMPNSETEKLKTFGIPASNSTTAGILGVQHNIHCLRSIRQLLYPRYYFSEQSQEAMDKFISHAAHCVESTLHSVMCVPDLHHFALIREDDERDELALNPAGVRRCINWESLIAWEQSHQITSEQLEAQNPWYNQPRSNDQ